MAAAKKVLIVDDSASMRTRVAERLRAAGYEVFEASDGVSGLRSSMVEKPDVIILDVVMPGLDGFALCRLIRSNGLSSPILMLTEKSTIEDKKQGFSSGADDYLPKPFDPEEVELRVEALLRRGAALPEVDEEKSTLNFGDLVIDLKGHRITLKQKEVNLTPIEFQILRLLAENPGVAFSRDDILNAIWETNYEGYKRNIDPHINRIRAKLEENPKKPRYLLTIWGIGYKFNEQIPQSQTA
jgi:DNA-binding response OmpR family regulator